MDRMNLEAVPESESMLFRALHEIEHLKNRVIELEASARRAEMRTKNPQGSTGKGRKLCNHYIYGKCRFGNQCYKVHERTQCKFYAERRCAFGDNCFNVHRDEAEDVASKSSEEARSKDTVAE